MFEGLMEPGCFVIKQCFTVSCFDSVLLQDHMDACLLKANFASQARLAEWQS